VVLLSFSTQSSNEIEKIEVYLNDALVDSSVGGLGEDVDYEISFSESLFNLQNLLVIRVTDNTGYRFEEELILYR